MKHYVVTRIVINKRGRVISMEKYPVAFETEKEMTRYMNGKWETAENNESFVAIRIR